MNLEVSIIIPTYNSENYIAQALESVFAQTYHNFEIILVDDASTDSTLDIARSFNDKRLQIIENYQNKGVSNARNCGIKKAKGDWIALLDSDDWYVPERLESLLKVTLEQDADLVADDLFLIGEQDKLPWSTLLQENQQGKYYVDLIDAVRFVMTDRPSLMSSQQTWSLGYVKPLMKRRFLLEHNIEYNESIDVGEDFVLYLECLINKARFLLVSRPYYYYRTRDLSLSTRKPTEYLAESCKITKSFIDSEKVAGTDSELLKAMYQNLEIFEKKLAYYRAVEYIQDKKFINVLSQILKTPYILIYLINKLITILQNTILAIWPQKKTECVSIAFDSLQLEAGLQRYFDGARNKQLVSKEENYKTKAQ